MDLPDGRHLAATRRRDLGDVAADRPAVPAARAGEDLPGLVKARELPARATPDEAVSPARRTSGIALDRADLSPHLRTRSCTGRKDAPRTLPRHAQQPPPALDRHEAADARVARAAATQADQRVRRRHVSVRCDCRALGPRGGAALGTRRSAPRRRRAVASAPRRRRAVASARTFRSASAWWSEATAPWQVWAAWAGHHRSGALLSASSRPVGRSHAFAASLPAIWK